MKEPTQEQIKRFWEWCGLRWGGYGNLYRWRAQSLPPIDPTNLFKYAVPKVRDDLFEDAFTRKMWGWMELVLDGDDPALALFWALDKVREDA